MAMSLRSRASLANQPLSSLFRLSLNFLRSFSTSSPQTSSATSSDPKKSKRRKKKNLFEVVQFLPNWGMGYHLAKSHWKNVSYEITKINLYKDGRHGKAWGVAYKDGLPADAPKKISGVHKHCWRYIPNLTKSKEGTTTSLKTPEIAPTSEA